MKIIPSGKLEAHFMFFYDLGIKITQEINKEKAESLQNKSFIWREVADSELSSFYFSDNFLARLIPIHFHGTNATFHERDVSYTCQLSKDPVEFDFPDKPIGEESGAPYKSYHFLEVTLDYNGILTVLIRLRNKSDISYDCYLDSIKYPEFLSDEGAPLGRNSPGELLKRVRILILGIEEKLAKYLTDLDIQCVAMESGEEKKIHVYAESLDVKDYTTPGKVIVDEKMFKHRLRKSRPYVGTIIDLSSVDNLPKYEDLQKLSVACARTTPVFLKSFKEVNKYMIEGNPRRNIYHPGPSIVFIGRRGWSCIKLEERDSGAFQMGITETVIFAIQSMHSSVRATRRFAQQLVEQGDKESNKIYTALIKGKGLKTVDSVMLEKIQSFTEFLSLARQNSPINDLSVILMSHITTHTGITAVERIRQLTGQDELIENTRQILNNYTNILDVANQFWESRNNEHQAKSIEQQAESLKQQAKHFFVLKITLIITVVGIVLSIIF